MMRRVSLFTALILLVVPAAAAEVHELQFDVRLTDGRTALFANPDFTTLKLTREQLEGAAGDRVLLLEKTTGARWTWLMLSWLPGKRSEYGLNARGVAAREEAVIGIEPLDEQSLRLVCLRDECAVTVSHDGGRRAGFTLSKDVAATASYGSRIRVIWEE